MAAPNYLDLPDGRRIAYSRTAAVGEGKSRPGVVFLGGFVSDMTGTKAMALESWAQRHGRACLRFDYTGHGASSGRFEDGCIGDWARDARDAIAGLTEGPQILVGSSMGGWIALLLARDAPELVAGLVGIAAAPDFTEDSMWQGMSAAQRQALAAEGRIVVPSEYSPDGYIITRRLIEDGRERLVLRAPLRLAVPARFLHGSADVDVPLSVPMRLIAHVEGEDIRLTVVKNSAHRFSAPHELDLIFRAIGEVEEAAANRPGGDG